MSWPSVGGTSVVRMTGAYGDLYLVDRVENVTRAGVDGVAFGEVGKKSSPVEVVTEHDAASFTTAESTFKNLEKKFVTVVTPEGRTILNVFVHSVSCTSQALVKSAGGVLGGSGVTAWVVARWVLQATE